MNVKELPADYHLMEDVDLLGNAKYARTITLLALVIAVAGFFLGRLRTPLGGMFAGRFLGSVVRIGCAVVCMFLYFLLHEWMHGVCIRILGKVKPKYGYAGIYLYTGTAEVWFDRKSYIIIALAPVVIWGLVLGFVSWVSTDEWFWVFHFIQIINLSGASGDLFITWKILRMPAGVLVQDTGVEMSFYGTT